MTTKDITLRTIALSEETAALFDCKKLLDECFNKIGEVHDTFFSYNEQFDEKLGKGYVEINELIMGLLTDQIDINSTESRCKVI